MPLFIDVIETSSTAPNIGNSTLTTTGMPEHSLTDPMDDLGLVLIVPVMIVLCIRSKRSAVVCVGKLFGVVIGDVVVFYVGAIFEDYIWIAIFVCIVFWNCLIILWDYCRVEHEDEATFNSNTVFSDLSTPLEKVVMLFAVQSILMQFYCRSAISKMQDMFDGSDPDERWKYFGAAVIVQLFVLDTTYESFPFNTWKMLLRSRGSVRIFNADDAQPRLIRAGLLDVSTRLFMAFMTKKVYAKIIVISLPVVLAGEPTGLDFVKDAFAVTFISELDRKDGSTFEVDSNDLESPGRSRELAGGVLIAAGADMS